MNAATQAAVPPMQNLAATSSALGGRPLFSVLAHWHQAWNGSLRFRLLVLGLMPLLVAFPFVMGVLVVVGGERADALLLSKLRAHLSSSHSYLNQLKANTGARVSQLVKSERLIQRVNRPGDRAELDALLDATAQSNGFDFLVVAQSDGRVVGASAGVHPDARLPDSFVTRQAVVGVANAAYERFDAAQLAAFSPKLASQSQPLAGAGAPPTGALLINAGAHFPLALNSPDVILVGGILLNHNFSLLDHLREIVFPVDSLPDDSEGVTAIFMQASPVAVSRQRHKGQADIRITVAAGITAAVLGQGQTWLGRVELDGQAHIAGFGPLLDGDGHPIGMMGAAFPDSAYRQSLWVMFGLVAGLLALTMLMLSLVSLRTGRVLTQRLHHMAALMTAVGNGDRAARVSPDIWHDELGQLGQHFNTLLDQIAAQDERQRMAQQTIADEASRRRALFEHERDGVAILNPDGSVFEANPKCAAMLGYSATELQRLNVSDWDAQFAPAGLGRMLAQVGAEGLFFETLQRRKDASSYPAEVSLSRATWGERSFLLVLQRDITERRAVEAELAQYRQALESRVEERTRQLNDQSEQLNTIFALSPDGFVSFDRALKVSFVNLAFQRMTGLDHADLIGQDEAAFSAQLASRCLPSSPFAGVAALRSARLKLTAQGRPQAAADSKRRPLLELKGPGSRMLDVGIRMSEAAGVAQILHVRDVTHETEVDRMKSEFLSTAAHELRTPMASIFGYAELLLMEDFEAEQRQQFLTIIYRQSELMASIINELLDLARIEARRGKDFDMQRTALDTLVAQTLADYQPPAGRQPPQLSAPAAPLNVKVDRKKMQQVVLNIISNAYKYSPGGQAVRVFFCTETSDGTAKVGVAVQDQGIGMNAEQLSRVCERFYRADTSGKIPGTGLGMSIVKEIVALFGGELTLSSQPGVGTTVTVWLTQA